MPWFEGVIRRRGKAPALPTTLPQPHQQSYRSQWQVLAGHHLEQSTFDQQAGGPGYSPSVLSPSSLLLYPGTS